MERIGVLSVKELSNRKVIDTQIYNKYHIDVDHFNPNDDETAETLCNKMKQHNPEEYSALAQVFNKFDKDCSGSLSEEESRWVFKELGYIINKKKYNKFFRRIDLNGDGNLDFEEFIFLFSSSKNPKLQIPSSTNDI